MARTPTEENRKVQLGLTVKRWIKEKLETMAEENETTMSKIVETALIEEFKKSGRL